MEYKRDTNGILLGFNEIYHLAICYIAMVQTAHLVR